MTGYIFKIKNNTLICTKVIDGTGTDYEENQAIDILKSIDKIDFTNVKINRDYILLESKKTRLYIRDEVIKSPKKYASYLQRNCEKITKAINKKSKKNVISKTTKIASIIVSLAIAAAQKQEPQTIRAEDYTMEFSEIESSIAKSNEEKIITNTESLIKELENTTPNIDYSNDYDLENQTNSNYLNDIETKSDTINLSFNTDYDNIKYQHVYDNYYDIIEKRSARWGISPKLITSLLSQESGGYETNLMQIQFNSWKDMPITLYNFEKGQNETIVLTNTPENYQSKKNIQTISETDLMNPKTNISVACIILRYSFEAMNHNIPATIQAYNFGVNNMKKVLKETSRQTGYSVNELLNDQTNMEFLKYRDIISVGDPLYLEHVFQYIREPEKDIYIKYLDEEGNIRNSSIQINNEAKIQNL